MKLVVKLSGKVLQDASCRWSICRQLERIVAAGADLIVVHGGGRQVTELCRKLDVPVVLHDGRRVTDEATLEVAKMVFSAINRDLTAALVSCGVRALGMAAFDCTLTEAERRGPILVGTNRNGHGVKVDFGFVGKITRVNPSFVESLWSEGCLPIISCLCADSSGQLLNINADTLASELALALGADRLVSVSNVAGIYQDPGDKSTLIRALTMKEAQKLLEGGAFLDGMIPKVQTALEVLSRGLPCFQVLSGLEEMSLIDGLEKNSGTIISAD